MQAYSTNLTPAQAALLQTLLPQGYSFQLTTLDTKRSRPPKKMDESFTTDFSIKSIRTPRKPTNPGTKAKIDSQERVETTPNSNKKVQVQVKDCHKANNTPINKEMQINLVKLLEKLKSNYYASPFLRPVDPEADGVPDYWEVIKEPMDLGTMEKKLKEGVYHCEQQFHTDVKKIISNSYTFNPKEYQIHAITKKFENFYLKMCKEPSNPTQAVINGKEQQVSPQKMQQDTKKGKKNDKKQQKEQPTKTQLSMGERLSAKQRQDLFHQIYNLSQGDIIKLVRIVDDGNLPRDWRQFVIDFKDIDDDKFKKIVDLVNDRTKSYS